MKVLVAETIGKEGIDILSRLAEVEVKTGLKPEELKAIMGNYDALVVRSQTKVTADIIKAGTRLIVVGRAGVGVDNIDVEEATAHAIVVVNAPTGNTISAAEHTVGLMFALARNIPQANASLKSGKWRRNDFMGIELRNKVLGLVGLGNVGSEVARRARGLEMKVIGFDPFVSPEYARKLQIEPASLEQVMRNSDFISLHVPLNDSTRGIIGARELAFAKPTACIVNAARGGLIDEEALVAAVHEKRLSGAAIDVFTEEPITSSILFAEEKIIVTPHLGASTVEAQALAARDVAEQIVAVLRGQPARYAVNAPFIPAETLSVVTPYIKAISTAGRLVGQLAEGQMSTVKIKYEGEIANYDTNALKAAALGGVLSRVSEERINLVNANLVAARRGLEVLEQKVTNCENYSSLVTIEVATTVSPITVAATVLRGDTHIVRVGEYWIDIIPTGGYFLFSDHLDRPGMIGAVGKITGDANINISYMHLGRLKLRGEALMILALDEALPEKQQREILAIPDVHNVKLVRI
ncbi:MAG: phosphoglycerate dehydrogenase [Chloroflexi bacterium RBG_16_57_8]|nr:MAG: phosphoglycerate dehydrogenase [Chloroflexi bacterium RBG_16_57_8]